MLTYSLLAVADPKIVKRGGRRQFISSVLVYRKCTQQNICLLHGKKRFLKKLNEYGGGRHPTVLWIRHWLLVLSCCSVASTASGHPPPEVTSSCNDRPVSSTAVEISCSSSIGAGDGSVGVASTDGGDAWPSQGPDEQLRRAVEMSQLLATSQSCGFSSRLSK